MAKRNSGPRGGGPPKGPRGPRGQDNTRRGAGDRGKGDRGKARTGRADRTPGSGGPDGARPERGPRKARDSREGGARHPGAGKPREFAPRDGAREETGKRERPRGRRRFEPRPGADEGASFERRPRRGAGDGGAREDAGRREAPRGQGRFEPRRDEKREARREMARPGGSFPRRDRRGETSARGRKDDPRPGRRFGATGDRSNDTRERTERAPDRAYAPRQDAHPRGARNGAGKRPPFNADAQVEREAREAKGPLWIYGRHAVIAALNNEERIIRRVVATAGAAAELRTLSLPPARLALIRETDHDAVGAALHDGAVHQGFAAEVGDLPRARLKETCEPDGTLRPVVVLDQITDPQNIGAIFRSAAAFGARAVIVQDRRTPPRAGALAKAAAGAVEIVPCIEVVNVARALEGLKAMGYFCAGLSGDATAGIGDVPSDRPVALVLGAEGAGLRRLVADTCDGLFRIPIAPAIESLNVSTAAAISLYAVTHRGRS